MDQPPQNAGQPQWVRPEVVPERPFDTPRRAKRSIFARLLMFLLVLGFLGSLLLNLLLGMAFLSTIGSYDAEGRVQEKFFSHQRNAIDKVAILSIEGIISSGEGFFKNQVDHAIKNAKDKRLKALVVRVNSPGGSINGSDYMLHHLKRLAEETQIPIVVSMGGLAASGGYYVSMCVGDVSEVIFAEPTTWTGSIGVIIPHYNIADLMLKLGIQEDAIASHPLKEMGTITRKMTEQERKIFEELVADGFIRFKDVIKQGRPKFRNNPADLDRLATGQIFTADQAVENGLVDKIGFLSDAVDRAIQLAGLDKENVKVVKYKAEPRLFDILFRGEGRARRSVELDALLDMTTPRAYYLCTWLPPLVGSMKDD